MARFTVNVRVTNVTRWCYHGDLGHWGQYHLQGFLVQGNISKSRIHVVVTNVTNFHVTIVTKFR